MTVVLDPCDPNVAIVDGEARVVPPGWQIEEHRGRLVAVPVRRRMSVADLAAVVVCLAAWCAAIVALVRWAAS